MPENNGHKPEGDLPFNDETCVSYLLGELSDAEQERFETAYFTDDAFFDRFMAVKTELLDLYARGELDPKQQEKVRTHFSATAPRAEQIAEASQFIGAVTDLSRKADQRSAAPETEESSRPFAWFPKIGSLMWAAAAILLFAAAGLWWISTQGKVQQPVDVAAVLPSPAPEAPRNDDIGLKESPAVSEDQEDTELRPKENLPTVPRPDVNKLGDPKASAPAPLGPRSRLVLGMVATRDINEGNTLRVYSDTKSVSILVPVGRSKSRFTATISTVDGNVHWRMNRAKPPVAGKLSLDLFPQTLKQSDYIITVNEVKPGGKTETVAEHFFHVARDEQKTPSSPSPK